MVTKIKKINLAETDQKSFLKRLREIEEGLAATSDTSRFFFLAIKQVFGDDCGMKEIEKARNFTILVAQSLGFDYKDVADEIALFHLKKIASKQLFDEIKYEERATVAIARGGGTIEESLNRVKHYADIRKPLVPSMDLNNLIDELDELDELPF